MSEPQGGWQRPAEPEPTPGRPPEIHWQAPSESAGPAPGVEYAGYGARLLAYVLDGLIVGAVFLVLFGVLGVLVAGTAGAVGADGPTVAPASVGAFVLFMLAAVVVGLAYFPFFWARGGQTPGMRPFGIRVVRDRDGGRVSAGQAILRLIGLYIAAIPLYLGYVWVFVDGRRRGWHDLIGGTVVIRDPARAAAGTVGRS